MGQVSFYHTLASLTEKLYVIAPSDTRTDYPIASEMNSADAVNAVAYHQQMRAVPDSSGTV